MITKASIRRFLWRHFPILHHTIYNDVLTQKETRELLDYIDEKQEEQRHLKLEKV